MLKPNDVNSVMCSTESINMKGELYEFYQELEHVNLSFIFNGDVSDAVIVGIIRLTKHNVSKIEELTKERKGEGSFMMVECFQNLLQYKGSENEIAVFSERNSGDANCVSSFNKIPVDNIHVLQGKLEQVNSVEKDKLKAFYLEVLRMEGLSEDGGADLELIQQTRKTGVPVDFEKVNNHLSKLYMSLTLLPNSIERQQELVEAKQFTQNFDEKIKDSNIVMIYKGDFARNSIMPIIAMLEEQMKSISEESQSKSFILILVEMLQNISRHAYDVLDRSGILMITDTGGRIGMYSGNIVSTKDKIFLQNKINELNRMGETELKRLYKATLREGTFSEKGGAGLGLIEVARKASKPMIAKFDKLGNDRHFFTYLVHL